MCFCVCVCGSASLLSCSNLKRCEQSGTELDNASRSEQWRRGDACDTTPPIGVDVKNGGEEEKKPSGARNDGNWGGEKQREEQETRLNEATSRLEL